VAFVAATMLLAVAGCASDFDRGVQRDVGGIVHFYGPITAGGVSVFIARHRGERVERVVVNSMGGDVEAGIRLGNWIVDRGADVEVDTFCGSSCANYLFAAGRRKIIDADAIVVWHGSIQEKRFRDTCAATANTRKAFDPAFCDAYRALIALQTAFFTRVGVDEYVTRLGREPRILAQAWTVPVDVMARFGLTGVEARANYGTHTDLAQWTHRESRTESMYETPFLNLRSEADHTGRRFVELPPAATLGLDSAGRVVELAR
jgi:hypothetical protein